MITRYDIYMSLKVGPKSPSNNNLLFNIAKFTVIISTGYFLKPFLKGKILRSSERGVNSILTTILQF